MVSGASGGNVGRLWVQFGADMTEFNLKMMGLAKRMEPIQRQMAKVGKKMTMYVTLPVLAFGAAAVKTFSSLEAGLANVSTLLDGEVGPRIEEFEEDIKRLAIATGKPFEDLTDGLYETVSAYGDTAESAKKLELSVRAGVAGIAATLDSVKLLSAVTKAYGDTSYKAMLQASDLAFMTVKLGQTTFPELAVSMQNVLSMGSQMKVDLRELFAVFATLTGVTGGAAEVSTQLASILSAMMKPTAQFTTAIEGLRFGTAEATIEALGLVETLRRLLASTDGTTKAVGALFSRKEALRAIFSLTGDQAEVFNTKLEAMSSVAGMTDKAFEKQMATLKGLGGQIKQTFLVALSDVGKGMAPILKKTIFPMLKDWGDKLRKIAEQFAEMPAETQRNIIAFAGLAVIMGPVIIALKSVIMLMAGLRFLLAGPWGVIALMGALSAYVSFKGLIDFDVLAEKLTGHLSGLKDELKDVMEELDGVGEEAGKAAEKQVQALGAIAREVEFKFVPVMDKLIPPESSPIILRAEWMHDFLEPEPLLPKVGISQVSAEDYFEVKELSEAAKAMLDGFEEAWKKAFWKKPSEMLKGMEAIKEAAEEAAKVVGSITDPLTGRTELLTQGMLKLAKPMQAIKLAAEQATSPLGEVAALSEETQAAYYGIRREMLGDFEQEVQAIRDGAQEFRDAKVDEVTISKWVAKKERELAAATAAERMGQLNDIQTQMEETFRPGWLTAKTLARKAAEAGIRARFEGGGADRFAAPAAAAATAQETEAVRREQRMLKVLDEIRDINSQMLQLEQMNPAGTVG